MPERDHFTGRQLTERPGVDPGLWRALGSVLGLWVIIWVALSLVGVL